MIAFLALWSHAVAALLFGALALWQLRAPGGGGRKAALVAALLLTALWALAVAGTGASSGVARAAESLRTLGFLGFMVALLRAGGRDRRTVAVATVYAVVALVGAGTVLLALFVPLDSDPALALADCALRMMVTTGALVLVHNLYSAAGPESGVGFRVAIYALAALWIYDLNLYTIAYLGRGWPEELAALRGLVAAGVALMLGLGVHRADGWSLQLSRSMTFRTLSLAAIGLYLIAMVLVTSAIGLIGGDSARLAQAAFVFGTSAAALALPNRHARAWLKVKLAKHLFSHRYDYRAEWLRFTDTLGKPDEATAPLAERVIKAVADITDSPDGLLFVPDSGALALAAQWNWPTTDTPPGAIPDALVARLAAAGRIVELDVVRRDPADRDDLALLPQWLIDDARAWVLVPLVHFDRLAGLVVLGRPPLNRALDWEDFDLLRVAARQVASYLAENLGQQALDDARRFDEFNRRFAFIMHDIKNLVSQLSLVARNAERHADNPDFRADMVATLHESSERMNALLARLAQHNNGRVEPLRPVSVDSIVAALVAEKGRVHQVVAGRVAYVHVRADPARLDKLLGHLVQNAIDASPAGVPVRIDVRVEGGEVAIDVIDRGCGMAPAFVREKLFTAFASTKPTGFGVGAYEARQLARAMDGRIEVASREGEGSRFSVYLPIVENILSEQAA